MILVREGVYDEEVTIAQSGEPDNPLVLRNYPGERPIIDSHFTRQQGIVVRGSFVTVEGFHVRNCKAQPGRPRSMGGVVVQGPGVRGVVVRGNVIHHMVGDVKAPRGVYCARVNGLLIENNTIYDVVGHTESMGIQVDGCANVALPKPGVSLRQGGHPARTTAAGERGCDRGQHRPPLPHRDPPIFAARTRRPRSAATSARGTGSEGSTRSTRGTSWSATTR